MVTKVKVIPSEPFKYVVHLVLIIMMLLNVFALNNVATIVADEMIDQTAELESIDSRLESIELKLSELEVTLEDRQVITGATASSNMNDFTLHTDEYVAFINTVGPVLRQNPEMIQVLAIYWIAQNPIIIKYFDELEEFLPFEGD